MTDRQKESERECEHEKEKAREGERDKQVRHVARQTERGEPWMSRQRSSPVYHTVYEKNGH